jgi:hypothetical protein
MVKGSLWKFEIAEASHSIAADFFPGFSLESDFLDVKLNHFPDGVAGCDFAVDPGYAQLIFDGVEIPLGDFDFDGGDVPALVPDEASFLLVINFFIHWNLNVQFRLCLVFLQLDRVFRF